MQPALKLSPEALRSLGSMEGAYTLPIVEKKSAAKLVPAKINPVPGWLLAAIITLVAYAIHYLPFAPFRVEGPSGVRRPVSAAILAIFAGALAATVLPLGKRILHGAKHAARTTIPLTIVLTGATLSFANATAVGMRALIIIVGT